MTPASAAGIPTDAAIDRAVHRLVAVVAGLCLLAFGVLITIHLGDAFGVDHASGVWMALAVGLRDGQLYPPLFDGEHFGGARYMPIPIGLYALANAVIDDPVVSLKLVNLAAAAALVAVLAVILRAGGTSRALTLGLIVSLLVTQTGLMVATGRSDAMPAALQLAAIGLVAIRPSRRTFALAALLCVAAFLTKVTAIYAPLAIGIWLVATDRRGLLAFGAVFVVGLGASLGLLHLLTDGRMLANFQEVSTSGITLGTILRAPLQALEQVQAGLGPILVLLPFIALAAVSAAIRRSVTVIDVALIVAVLVLLVVMTDTGAAYNHHVDVATLILLVVGGLATAARRSQAYLLSAAIGCAVLVGNLLGTTALILPDVQRGISGVLSGTMAAEDDPHPLAALIGPDDSLLSEDPTVPVSLGRRPVILDPVMLLRFQRNHPDWTASLVARIEAGEFDRIVLLRDLDDPGAEEWYREWHLGTAVEAAIRDAYRLDATVGRYHLYVPKTGG